jgi:hypothetical protein
MIGKLANQIASETTERNLYQLASAKCFELAGALELRVSPLPSYLSLLCHGLRPVCHRVLSPGLSPGFVLGELLGEENGLRAR